MNNIPKIKISSKDKHIDNLDEIINFLNDYDDIDEIIKYRDILNNYSGNIDNISLITLVNALNGRINEINNSKLSLNEQAVNKLKRLNPDKFKNISIVKISRELSDINKYSEYICLKNDDDSEIVGMLECPFGNNLNNFLNEHTDFASKYDANDLFDYFETFVHNRMKQEKLDDYLNNHPNEANNPEIMSIINFAKSNGINKPIFILGDSNSDMMFAVGSALLKFAFSGGKRKLTLLDTGHEQIHGLGDSLAQEEEKKDINDISQEDIYPEPINDNFISKVAIKDEIGFSSEIFVDLSQIKGILYSLMINKSELSEDDNLKLNNFINSSLKLFGDGKIDSERMELVNNYFEFLKDESNIRVLNPDEMNFVTSYGSVINKNEEFSREDEQNLKEKDKVKVLTLKPIKNNDHSGNILTIAIIDITLLLALTISALLLALM